MAVPIEQQRRDGAIDEPVPAPAAPQDGSGACAREVATQLSESRSNQGHAGLCGGADINYGYYRPQPSGTINRRSSACGGEGYVYDTPGALTRPDREILPELKLAREHLDPKASTQKFDYLLPKGGGVSHIEAHNGQITSAEIVRLDGSSKKIDYIDAKPRLVHEKSRNGIETNIVYGENGDRQKRVNYPDGRSHWEHRFGGTAGDRQQWTIVRDTEANGDYVQHKVAPDGTQVSRNIEKTIGESPSGRKIYSKRFTTKNVDELTISSDGNVLANIDLKKQPAAATDRQPVPRPAYGQAPIYELPQ